MRATAQVTSKKIYLDDPSARRVGFSKANLSPRQTIMGQKRKRDETQIAPELVPEAKKRKGFRVGPDNLPDGAWRRKVIKVKKELIQKAKVKKSYAKVKAREKKEARQYLGQQALGRDDNDDVDGENAAEDKTEMHPDRVALLGEGQYKNVDDEGQQAQARRPRRDSHGPRYDSHDARHVGVDAGGEGERGAAGRRGQKDGRRRGHQHEYLAKERSEAARKRQAAEERRTEARRREEEREERVAERRQFKKKAKKAHVYNASGQRKLGRESTVLLEKVKKLMGKP